MNPDNPYRPPDSSIEPPQQKPVNTIWWKIFFWITALMTTLTVAIIPLLGGLNLLDYLDLIIYLIALAGLYGFAFYKPIGQVLFWRYFFYILLFEAIIYSGILPFAGICRALRALSKAPGSPLRGPRR